MKLTGSRRRPGGVRAKRDQFETGSIRLFPLASYKAEKKSDQRREFPPRGLRTEKAFFPIGREFGSWLLRANG
ncbi:hypothetical protein MA16_Dca003397 [Dendrobium catenatum]|uniref:Uncharacterized protein n=1 Tax=Dendrobium catenatum TaxID=906689 RepID=A0A2I0XCN2_9ASPA|nr:hypothetical protein MA16_Dca003397 [Dendrobium catenatum]